MAFESTRTQSPPASDEGYGSAGVASDADPVKQIEPIAVVGFSLKFPGDATDSTSFWNMIMEGRCATTKLPSSRLNVDAFHHRQGVQPGAIVAKGGHFVEEDLGAFDASFFSISPAEASSMDPQHRILLETTYRALENAGLSLEAVKGSLTGVYTGSFSDDYRRMVLKDPEMTHRQAATGTSFTMLAARLSWFFDLKGPSMSIDTACSSSMVAIDLACQALQSGDCSMALVGGSNLVSSPEPWQLLSNMSFISPDDRCFSFDSRANGYSRGEGFAVAVLKPLSSALEDGDTIRGIIRSTGSNQDGKTAGITQPNDKSQEALIRATYKKAGLDPSKTEFFEAHGTGTALGDPTECAAISSVFRPYRSHDSPLYVGAVKSNIGHLEGAAGIAGLIKALLTVEKGIIPPNTNFRELNPSIPAKEMALTFPLSPALWPTQGLRRASVNSFGFGGTNSHVVIDDVYHYLEAHGLKGNHCTIPLPNLTDSYPPRLHIRPETVPVSGATALKVLTISTHDTSGIARQSQSYAIHFRKCFTDKPMEARYLADLAYTLTRRRTRFTYNAFALCSGVEDLLAFDTRMSNPIQAHKKPSLCMVFTGQGAQYAQMGLDLLYYDVFRACLHTMDNILLGLGCNWSLLEELAKPVNESRINEPEFSQPLCTALQIALINLLRSMNIIPSVVVGHSSGEIAAAYACGGLSLTSAVKVSYYRGLAAAHLLSQGHRSGSMLAIGLGAADVDEHLRNFPTLSVACHNGPTSTTVSGDTAAIDLLKVELDRVQVFNRVLKTGLAYHSTHMHDIADHYLDALGVLQSDTPTSNHSKMISSVHVREVTVSELRQAQYWVDNLTHPVRFAQAIFTLFKSGPKKKKLGSKVMPYNVTDILEIGPHCTLQGPIKDSLKSAEQAQKVAYYSLLQRKKSSQITTLETVGQLSCLGYPVHLDGVNLEPDVEMSSLRILPDLPEYQFDHSKTYWFESRISENYRHRKVPRHELLGVPSEDWNSHQPVWRNFIRISELPWVEDHKVHGQIIYPATGLLAMGIEAVKQMSKQPVESFLIDDAVLSQALIIPQTDEGIEVRTHLRCINMNEQSEPVSYEFTCYSSKGDDWQEHCRGQISVECYKDHLYNHEIRQTELLTQERRELLTGAQMRCTNNVDRTEMYDFIKSKIGLNYGPHFQRLSSIRFGKDTEAVADIEVLTEPDTQPHVAHPATLDSVAQMCFVAMSKGGSELVPTTVPTRIRGLWIRASGMNAIDTPSTVRAYVKSCYHGFRGTSSQLFVMDQQSKELLMYIEELQTTHLAETMSVSSTSAAKSSICYGIEWKPDITLMSGDQVRSYCEKKWKDETLEAQFQADLRTFQFYHIVEARRLILKMSSDNLPQRYARYLDWTETQISQHRHDKCCDAIPRCIAADESALCIPELATRIEQTNARGVVHAAIARNMQDIFSGLKDPREMLFNHETAEQFYADMYGTTSCCDHIETYIDLLAHQNPGMKVLEIGAGTGGLTTHILRPLTSGSQARCAEYMFTDSSPIFFERMQKSQETDAIQMKFKTLDIEKDPLSQGFESECYDVIVAGIAIVTAANIRDTMRNVRRLLKPGGRVVMVEIIKPESPMTAFVFGLLDNWWSSIEPERSHGPCMDIDMWGQVLDESGFQGIDFVLHDHKNVSLQEIGIIVATAAEDLGTEELKPVTLVVDKSSATQLQLAQTIEEILGRTTTTTIELQELDTLEQNDSKVVSLLEVDSSVFEAIGELTFNNLKKLLSSTMDLVWITAGTQIRPTTGMVQGLARTVRLEKPDLSFVTLAFESELQDIKEAAQRIFASIQAIRPLGEQHEPEYRLEQEHSNIGRIVQLTDMDNVVQSNLTHFVPTSQDRSIGECGPLKLSITTAGILDTLHFADDTSSLQDLGPCEVEISVTCFSVNASDVRTITGQSNQTDISDTCCGFITRIGSGVSRLSPGDRVIACKSGCSRTLLRQNHGLVVRLPDSMSRTEAATLPTTFVPVYHGLIDLAGLDEGERILIHAGVTNCGQAAIQIAKMVGAEIYVTIESDDDRTYFSENHSIPDDHIFSSYDRSVIQGVQRVTNKQGVDVVFDACTNSKFTATWKCIAPFGRYIELDNRGLSENHRAQAVFSTTNVSFHRLDYTGLLKHRPKIFARTLRTIVKLVNNGKLSVTKPVSTFPASHIINAFEHCHSSLGIDQVLIQFQPEHVVPTISRTLSKYSFQSDATYVIAGGLGGLGRSIARWMCLKGARNLILLSRSGPRIQPHHELLDELHRSGVHVEAPPCDIASETALQFALSDCLTRMPQIKGCIQSTMVINDFIFDNMDHSSWLAATRPKVQGSWNLHNILPSDLEFFILLSSVTGVLGSLSQSNYGAGNTYQDALASYRISRGQKAVAIDVGWMADEGYLAENERAQQNIKGMGALQPLSQHGLLSVLEHYCNPTLVLDAEDLQTPSQIVLGLELPITLRMRSIEEPPQMQQAAYKILQQQRPVNVLFGQADTVNSNDDQTNNPATFLANAVSKEQAISIVRDALVQRLCRAIGITSTVVASETDGNGTVTQSALDTSKPLFSYGIDSLLALELRNWCTKVLASGISVLELLGGATVDEIVELVTMRSTYYKSG